MLISIYNSKINNLYLIAYDFQVNWVSENSVSEKLIILQVQILNIRLIVQSVTATKHIAKGNHRQWGI